MLITAWLFDRGMSSDPIEVEIRENSIDGISSYVVLDPDVACEPVMLHIDRARKALVLEFVDKYGSEQRHELAEIDFGVASKGMCNSVCPKCGSENVYGDAYTDEDEQTTSHEMACLDCETKWVNMTNLIAQVITS